MSVLGEIYLISFFIINVIAYLLYRKLKALRFLFLLFGIISSLIYIIWRFTVVPETGISIVMGVLLLIAEAMGIIQSKGYDSILVNKPLVLGLSETTLEESIKQRKRWARGNIQVFKRNNPLFMKGLKLE